MRQQTITRPSFLVMLFTAIVGLLITVSLVFAQEATDTATPEGSPTPPAQEIGGVTFPIPELGGCADFTSCANYCEDPVNNTACTDFAKKQGFYQPDPVQARDADFFTEAEDVLGCNSAEVCFDYCANPTNYDACNAFAQSQDITGGYVEEPGNPEFLDAAETV